MEKDIYIQRLHCHQRVLLSLLDRVMRAETLKEKKELIKRVRSLKEELKSERYDAYCSYHFFSTEILKVIALEFLFYLKSLIKR